MVYTTIKELLEVATECEELSLRQISKITKISLSTLSRMKRGEGAKLQMKMDLIRAMGYVVGIRGEFLPMNPHPMISIASYHRLAPEEMKAERYEKKNV